MKDQQIRERLKQIIKETVGESSLLATVKSVNEDEFTCVLVDDDNEIEYEDVRLTPVIDSKSGLVLIPKINTWVLAVRVESDEDWVIVSVSEVDKVKIKVVNNTLEFTSSGLKSEVGSAVFEQTSSKLKSGIGTTVFEQSVNTFKIENTVANLKEIIEKIIDATIIINPTTPANVGFLTEAKVKLNLLLQ